MSNTLVQANKHTHKHAKNERDSSTKCRKEYGKRW